MALTSAGVALAAIAGYVAYTRQTPAIVNMAEKGTGNVDDLKLSTPRSRFPIMPGEIHKPINLPTQNIGVTSSESLGAKAGHTKERDMNPEDNPAFMRWLKRQQSNEATRVSGKSPLALKYKEYLRTQVSNPDDVITTHHKAEIVQKKYQVSSMMSDGFNYTIRDNQQVTPPLMLKLPTSGRVFDVENYMDDGPLTMVTSAVKTSRSQMVTGRGFRSDHVPTKRNAPYVAKDLNVRAHRLTPAAVGVSELVYTGVGGAYAGKPLRAKRVNM